jgi:hypothetical protein
VRSFGLPGRGCRRPGSCGYREVDLGVAEDGDPVDLWSRRVLCREPDASRCGNREVVREMRGRLDQRRGATSDSLHLHSAHVAFAAESLAARVAAARPGVLIRVHPCHQRTASTSPKTPAHRAPDRERLYRHEVARSAPARGRGEAWVPEVDT